MVSEIMFSASPEGRRAARTIVSGTTRKIDTTSACWVDNRASIAGGGTSSVPYTIVSGFRMVVLSQEAALCRLAPIV